MEHTNADGYTVKQDIANHWTYTQLFSSFSIKQDINDNNKVDISISRRINRLSYTDQNPVRGYSNQYFYYSGNPNLVPEPGWVYSAIYSLKKKYIFSVAYNHSNNYINRKLVLDDNGVAIKSQSANFGSMKRLDITASISVSPLPFWKI